MKKYSIFVLALVLTAALLTACGCRNSKPMDTVPTTAPTTEATRPTTQPTTAPTTAPTKATERTTTTDGTVDHGNGVVSIYKNLSKELAEGITQGAKVTAGQKLGTVGESALIESAEEPHLHFEMTYEGESVDPLTYISEDSRKVSLSADTAYES